MNFWTQFWTAIVVIEWTIILIFVASMLVNWIKKVVNLHREKRAIGPFAAATDEQLTEMYNAFLTEYVWEQKNYHYALAERTATQMKKVGREIARRNRGGK